MKTTILTCGAFLYASLAFAAPTTPTEGRLVAQAPATPAPEATVPAAPVQGANSFTEAQARTHLEDAGFRNVTGLTLGSDGVWRANAELGGTPTEVTVDYQGNITKR